MDCNPVGRPHGKLGSRGAAVAGDPLALTPCPGKVGCAIPASVTVDGAAWAWSISHPQELWEHFVLFFLSS